MFLYLGKILPLFAYPPGLTLLILIFAALIRKRWARTSWTLFSFAILSLWVLSTSYVGDTLIRTLEGQYPEVAASEAPQADAIVVLGGYLHSPGPNHSTAEMNEAGDRLWMGAKLYREQKAPLVLLTGGNVPMYRRSGVSEAIVAKDLLHEWGVPLEAILVESQSRTTRENATLSKPILDSRGAKRILLVTSAFHMPRAAAIFRSSGINATPIPTDYQTGWDSGEVLFAFLPESDSLYRSTLALREWLGLTAYKLRGWA